MKKYAISLLIAIAVSATAQTNVMVGFTPSPDVRTTGHTVCWGVSTNAYDMYHWVGNCSATASSFCLSCAASPPPGAGCWISVYAYGTDGTNDVASALATPVYYSTNLFPPIATPPVVVVTNVITPLAPPGGLNLYRR